MSSSCSRCITKIILPVTLLLSRVTRRVAQPMIGLRALDLGQGFLGLGRIVDDDHVSAEIRQHPSDRGRLAGPAGRGLERS